MKESKSSSVAAWNSPLSEKRWQGFRRVHRGLEAFHSLENFEKAQISELEESLKEHERQTLGRLLSRGKKIEIDIFIRSHGVNPIFPPQDDVNVKVGVAKADLVSLEGPASAEANRAILNGDVVHVLFQAGEASRFGRGPFYLLKPLTACESMSDVIDVAPTFERIHQSGKKLLPRVSAFLKESELGPKQPVMIRAALRRVVQDEINTGRCSAREAELLYRSALAKQKLLFFITAKNNLGEIHFDTLKNKFHFFGFDPNNVVTVEQQLVRGVSANERGDIFLEPHAEAVDAAGHLYALLQAARPGDFTTYSETGRPLKSNDTDGLAYLANRGGKILSIIRINDLDRHTTEIINAKALSHALRLFEKGYVNVMEGVSNPAGQKGGTAATFGDPDIHVLTETHENSFPSFSRAFETAMQTYLSESGGLHPAYNAMRQWSDLAATRQALQGHGGRLVFIPRQKEAAGKMISYLGADLPMGDLTLLCARYPSRMFQFVGPGRKELHIHDMKTAENIPMALRILERQLQDPHVIAAAEEILTTTVLPFKKSQPEKFFYGAPAPEFD